MEPHRSEALLAWRIFQVIEKLSNLLFDRYEQEFQDFDLEEEEASLREDFFSAVAQATTSLELGDGPFSPLPSGRWEE
ncbi:MAG: hypothetical protein ACXWMO_13060 [Syntrophales bacterium]